jgi:mono/diheme cytochrome c family protein
MKTGVLRWGLGGLAVAFLAFLSTAPLGAQSDTEKLYKTKCASCHAADGSGDTPIGKKTGVHDFRSAEVQKMSDAELTAITAKGKNKMPSYEKTLKEAEIKALVAHIRTFAKK